MDWNRYKPLIHADQSKFGVRLRRPDRMERVGRTSDLDVLLIRPSSSSFAKRRAEQVARLAMTEPLGEGGYGTPQYYAGDPYNIVPELHAHALLLCHQARGVGMLVCERRPVLGHLEWQRDLNNYGELVDEPSNVRWAVVHIWVMSQHRKKGAATGMIKILANGLHLKPSELAWMPPFSTGGKAMLRSFQFTRLLVATNRVPSEDVAFDQPWRDAPPRLEQAAVTDGRS